MTKYHVDVYESVVTTVEVEADSPGDAVDRVLEGEGDTYARAEYQLDTNYSGHHLPRGIAAVRLAKES